MKAVSKRGAALAIVIVVSAAILILSAALISAAAYNVGSSQNGLEGRQAYLDAKSAIEYGKAYVKKNPDCGDFTVLADSDPDSSGFKIGTGGTSLAAYDSTGRTIKATAKYKSSDRVRGLTYTFPALIGGGSPAYIDVGKQHGSTHIFNGSNDLDNATVNAPVVAKGTVKLNGTLNEGLKADQIYFMGSGKCFEVTGNNAITTLTSDFMYFNSEIRNVSGGIVKLAPKNNSNGIVYFNRVKIKTATNRNSDDSDSELDGYYLFSGTVSLFDESSEFTKLTEEQVLDRLNGENLTGEELIATKKYVEDNYTKMVSGDRGGLGWTDAGNICGGLSASRLEALDQSVYMYIINTNDWNNNIEYKADEIHIQYVNNQDFKFPASKTVTFMADRISLNTQIADNDVGEGDSSKPKIYSTNGTSHCILKPKDGSHDLYLTFHYMTTVYCSASKVYDIKPGTYHITKKIGLTEAESDAIGIDLFTDGDSSAMEYFANTDPAPVGSTGGSGGSGGSTGGYYSYD